MANRHLSRSVALQSLFEWDFNNYTPAAATTVVRRNVLEFAPGLEDTSFVDSLVGGVMEHQPKLDLIIGKAAPDWPIEQIAIVDRNILRLGLYELLFVDKKEVPARVAINEAIELAKTFGGETSGKFVNGVLGAVYKEMGEPGKADIPAKKKRVKDLPYDQMPIERLGGAVVYLREGGTICLALVHDIFGYWTLSKGHIEATENLLSGTAREIKEELSLDVTVKDKLGENEYISSDPEKGKIRKQVVYFLAEAKDQAQLHLTKSGGLDEARWFNLPEIADLRMYDDVVPFITKAIGLLTKK
ncbi:MAG: transcription antitermination factor NusB [Candidatus Vogelbacteria bacterium]|nr:transcription antitermination factor NusB [Candidatus Vogelbacteria bacterium]